MSNTLLPCPFCNGEAAVRDIKEPSVNGWVGCQRCRCFMDFVKNGKPQAIAAWNRRANHIRDATKMVSNADRILGMSDEELAEIIASEPIAEKIPFCKNKPECDAMLDANLEIPESMCAACALDWLQQPAEAPNV